METEREPLEDKATGGPSGIEGIANGVRNLVAGSTASPEKKEVAAEGEKEPCETCGGGKTDEELLGKQEPPKTRFFIVDKETGREIPAVFKSEGKEYIPDSVDKLLTWTGLGIHSNKRAEERKEQDEFVKILQKAKAEGRLIIKDEETPSRSQKEDVEEIPEDDEILTDPALISVRKELKALKAENKALGDKVDASNRMVVEKTIKETVQEINAEIDKYSKQYPLANKRRDGVWNLLGKTEIESGKPIYTTEQAMKKVHEDAEAEIKESIKEHPDFVEVEKIKKEAIAEYLKDKEEKEKAPVSSPSGAPISAGGGPKEEIKGIADIPGRIKSLLESSKAAGKKL